MSAAAISAHLPLLLEMRRQRGQGAERVCPQRVSHGEQPVHDLPRGRDIGRRRRVGDQRGKTVRLGVLEIALDHRNQLVVPGAGSPGILLPADINSLSRSVKCALPAALSPKTTRRVIF
jgi:hypothetical protein